jgi:cytosine/adenosine deaminase-related metal-dependent hydrolase
VGNAKAVGMEKEVGRLKEGMKADLVVETLSSLKCI